MQAPQRAQQQAAQAVQGWLGPAAPTSDAGNAAPGSGSAQDAHNPTSWFGRLGQSVGDIGRGVQQEGLGGLLDMGGMLDRQDAQRDLSNRFQVMPHDFVGPRNHNQVSQEEYQRIAHTYSDIRTGRGDMTIATDSLTGDAATNYRDGMMNGVADIMMTTAGRQQVMGLSNNTLINDDGTQRLDADGNAQHRHTTIRPDIADDGSLVTNNAGVGMAPTSTTDDDKYLQYDPVTGLPTGRGAGTDANLYINPTLQVGDCNRLDVIMAHEMQHVQNRTQGTMLRGTHVSPTGPDGNPINDGDNGTNMRERQAVGLPNGTHYPGDTDGCTENTYREQRNQINPEERLAPRNAYAGRFPGQSPTVDANTEAWRQYHANNPTAR